MVSFGHVDTLHRHNGATACRERTSYEQLAQVAYAHRDCALPPLSFEYGALTAFPKDPPEYKVAVGDKPARIVALQLLNLVHRVLGQGAPGNVSGQLPG